MSGVQGTPETLGAQSAGLLDFGSDALFYTPKTNRRGIVKTPQMFRLNAGNVGANVTTAQNVFPKSVTLEANTAYEFELMVVMSKSAGATTHTISSLFAGTVGISQIARQTIGYDAPLGTSAAPQMSGRLSATEQAVVAGPVGTNPTRRASYIEKGTLVTSTGGTFIPQYIFSAAPGAPWTVEAGSYFWIAPLGASGADTEIGTWA